MCRGCGRGPGEVPGACAGHCRGGRAREGRSPRIVRSRCGRITIQLSAQRATDSGCTITGRPDDSHASDTHRTHFLPGGGRPRGRPGARAGDPERRRRPGGARGGVREHSGGGAVVDGVGISGRGDALPDPAPPAAAGIPGAGPPRSPPGPLRTGPAFPDAKSPSSAGRWMRSDLPKLLETAAVLPPPSAAAPAPVLRCPRPPPPETPPSEEAASGRRSAGSGASNFAPPPFPGAPDAAARGDGGGRRGRDCLSGCVQRTRPVALGGREARAPLSPGPPRARGREAAVKAGPRQRHRRRIRGDPRGERFAGM